MLALITGASSGMGSDIARELVSRGNKVILTARNKERLKKLEDELGKENVIDTFVYDLSDKKECLRLYDKVKDYNIDLLVNNAGFGVFGEFIETDLDREIEMINVNIISVHILTKLFLRDFVKKNRGSILNVASSAGFMAGPLLASYYGTKNYVLRLTQAIHEELRRRKSKVYIGAFCPGPVDTNFNNTAGVAFSVKSITSRYAAKCAVDQIYKRKLICVPRFILSLGTKFIKVVPDEIVRRVTYNFQMQKK